LPFSRLRVSTDVEIVEICRVTAHAGHVPANQLDGLIELLLLPTRDENVGTSSTNSLALASAYRSILP